MTSQIPFAFDVPSVSDLTNRIKTLLENNFRDILVEGEISNVSQSRNGHYYFTVKDDDAQLPCVIWRGMAQRLNVDLRDGQQVVLGGDLQVYPPHGRYQMIVSLVQQAGTGKLQQKFEQLKHKLEAEGLFRDDHKKPLPPYPFRIGVITSSTGAAFQDIRSTFEHRWPAATLYLYHASVQGLNAAGELVRGLDYFANEPTPVELIIIGRGGGSLEDLWPFNEEPVARAIYNSPIPVISAVGHEVDYSISDFVADARAATPTQAAVIAAPDIDELRYQIEDYTEFLGTYMDQKFSRYREYISTLAKSHALLVVQEKLRYHRNRTDSLAEKLSRSIERKMNAEKNRLGMFQAALSQNTPERDIRTALDQVERQEERLRSHIDRLLVRKRTALREMHSHLNGLNPNAPLERGFARVHQNGVWIRSSNNFSPQKPTEIEWGDGKLSLGKT
ncbi:exodeoxyribonuclease VII large subunit [Rhodohalobacter mucosus]|uniref:Exodeoxyribonuclease 7 large subunit n=1 Tax=Rhodohalobacter mucosus TaxID=2079485 RepID=A0A316TL29_9BACT|nr:exodeoxyribonuclease VII large subunit [Rhodohalobacter mucosus]PWN05070.1 exodeoxyribonuclease VII large subunit [Rhodohalobacter mucosus]